MTATIFLYSALICFQGHCYHALVGKATPTGSYAVTLKTTAAPGYGGDILVFKETRDRAYAIHRVYLRNPAQHRAERLASDDPAERRDMSMGCINVSPEVYEQLKRSLTKVEIVSR